MSRIQAEQMRLMTVLRFLVFPVVEPFLQVSFLANLVRQQTGKCFLYLFLEVFVCTQCFGALAASIRHSRVMARSEVQP